MHSRLRIITSIFIIFSLVAFSFAPITPASQNAHAQEIDYQQRAINAALDLAICRGGTLSERVEGAVTGVSSVLGGALLEQSVGDLGNWIENLNGAKIVDGFVDKLGGAVTLAAPGIGALASGLIGSLFGLGGEQTQAVFEQGLQEKEGCLDSLANATAKDMIAQLGQSVITYITGGDGRNPLFVDDLDSRLRAIADREFSHITRSGTFQSVCDAFKTDMARTLQDYYFKQYTDPSPERISTLERVAFGNTGSKCGLERVFDNNQEDLERFLSGDFSRGGWEAFYVLVTDPSSNPHEAARRVQQDLERRIAEAQQAERDQISYGSGFLPDKVCIKWADPEPQQWGVVGAEDWWWVDGSSGNLIRILRPDELKSDGTPLDDLEPPCLDEQVVTPGAVIERITNDIIGSEVRQAEYADEFNEIVKKSGDWLISKIFTRDGKRRGLRGLQGSDFNFINATCELRLSELRRNTFTALNNTNRIFDARSNLNLAMPVQGVGGQLTEEMLDSYTGSVNSVVGYNTFCSDLITAGESICPFDSQGYIETDKLFGTLSQCTADLDGERQLMNDAIARTEQIRAEIRTGSSQFDQARREVQAIQGALVNANCETGRTIITDSNGNETVRDTDDVLNELEDRFNAVVNDFPDGDDVNRYEQLFTRTASDILTMYLGAKEAQYGSSQCQWAESGPREGSLATVTISGSPVLSISAGEALTLEARVTNAASCTVHAPTSILEAINSNRIPSSRPEGTDFRTRFNEQRDNRDYPLYIQNISSGRGNLSIDLINSALTFINSGIYYQQNGQTTANPMYFAIPEGTVENSFQFSLSCVDQLGEGRMLTKNINVSGSAGNDSGSGDSGDGSTGDGTSEDDTSTPELVKTDWLGNEWSEWSEGVYYENIVNPYIEISEGPTEFCESNTGEYLYAVTTDTGNTETNWELFQCQDGEAEFISTSASAYVWK